MGRSKRFISAALLAATTWLLPFPALAACQLSKYIELPVTMRGARPIVSTQIEGKPAEFILDSGAFFSTLSRASAMNYGLRLSPLPIGFTIRGINGSASVSLATVHDFGLAGLALHEIQFLVGGSDTGHVGLLGQNFLGIGDVEYDLRHGAVRLLRAEDCKIDDLPYWATDRPVAMIPLEQRSLAKNHTIGTVKLNGVKLRAVFDTGAPTSILTLSAAKKAGITPASAGVTVDESGGGIGTRLLRTWIGRFQKLEIGEEAIPSPTIRFGEGQFDADMLIGVDFFLTHRIYVANKAAKMFFTYEGGPLFGLAPKGAKDGAGKAIDLTDKAVEPTDAEAFARRGAVHAANGKTAEAIGDLDRAIALAPNQARYFRQRAAIRFENKQPALAAADLDKAIAIDPGDIDARGMRAQMRLVDKDRAGAADDIRALDKALPPAAGQRLPLMNMADDLGLLEIALANGDAWLKSHPEDVQRPIALNGRCWVRAQLDRDLDKALGDCNAALRARPGNASYIDSRALVRLRQGDLPGALKDYDAVLKVEPKLAWSLYMRGIVKQKVGDAAGAEADFKSALAISPEVAERAAKLGFKR